MTEAESHRVATARSAGTADLETVTALRRRALDEVRVLRGGPLYVDREAVELPDPQDDDHRVVVGVLAGAVVGYLSARVADGLGKVDAIYVDAACRAVGVGEAMMAEAIDWFRSRGCWGADATALPGARATKNFFEETGFTARLLVMHRAL
jgi:GNAT superfamily N-acetyltransferase